MRNLERRVTVLEGPKGDWLDIGELLDRLDDPIDDGRLPHPDIVAALDAMSKR